MMNTRFAAVLLCASAVGASEPEPPPFEEKLTPSPQSLLEAIGPGAIEPGHASVPHFVDPLPEMRGPRYVSRMRVVPPDPSVDYKLRVAGPDPRFDYRMIVKTPEVEPQPEP